WAVRAGGGHRGAGARWLAGLEPGTVPVRERLCAVAGAGGNRLAVRVQARAVTVFEAYRRGARGGPGGRGRRACGGDRAWLVRERGPGTGRPGVAVDGALRVRFGRRGRADHRAGIATLLCDRPMAGAEIGRAHV